MKWNSIRTKVLAALVACLVVGVTGIMTLMRYTFERNSRTLATEAVNGSQRLFSILEAREISKMTAVSDTLVNEPQVRDAFAAKDRERLTSVTTPLYPQLKAEGITNWMFHTPEPDMTVFLRLHNPAKFGDHLNRFIDKEVARTHTLVSGNELAKAGFAVRILRPIYDAAGTLTGYLEFGEELGQFIHTMKSQTGDDYALLLSKKFIDRQFWADSAATWKRRDNWNDNADFVVAENTSDSNDIIRFDGELGKIPAGGMVLERYQKGDAVFVRGLFPIHDAAGNNVGAMFLVRDISSFYLTMWHTQSILIVSLIGILTVGMLLVMVLLTALIFRRLEHIIGVATRVVGGDYDSEIRVTSDDEVGQFEQLFEQFRQVFVNVLSHVPELQGKH